jgi:hypothetical protein
MTTSIKTCFKCGETKSISDFYRHKMMGDGHLNKCIECAKRDVREGRRVRIDKYRAYDAARAMRPDRVAARERYQQTEAGKAAVDRARRRYQERHWFKRSAHHAVNNAVRDGRLHKPMNCSKCGTDGRIYGHHDDYSKPLAVRWLCSTCHRDWHREHGEAKCPQVEDRRSVG